MAGEQWHHMQLIDKLESRSYDNCQLCGQSVLGTRGYKCKHYCASCFIHESCLEPTDRKREIRAHDLRNRHHLISMKEVEKNGDEKKVVVCSLCEEPVSSLLMLGNNNNNINFYKCYFPNCTFLIHQPCAQLPYKTTHPLHFSDHELRLEVPVETQNHCSACFKVLSGRYYYKCFRCEYALDIKCNSRWRNISADKCNPHAFIPTRDPIEFTCKACGVKRNDFASHCSNCLIFIHTNCGKFLGTIKIRGHAHSLTCTFSFPQGKKHKCQVCYEEVDIKYAAYCCDDHKCDYIAHLQCAYWFRVVGETSDFVDYTTHLVEGNDLKEDEKVAPLEIQHLSLSQHKLILKNEELLDVKRCKGCMQFIVLSPFYDCTHCNFSLHIRCTKLPQKVMRPLHHEHPLTQHFSWYLFNCQACKRRRSGFNYKCDNRWCRNETFDAQCILIPEVFKHKGHQHRLFLGGFDQPKCNACGQRFGGTQTFDCTTCGFRLCIKCATLPLVTRHRYDTHLIYLNYAAEDNSDEHYCQICEKERDEKLWFYYCKNCDFAAHPQCILGSIWLD